MHTTVSTSDQSVLLTAARPFYWALSFCAVLPPPLLTFDAATMDTKYKAAARLLYGAFLLTVLLLTMWASYIMNIITQTVVDSFNLGSIIEVLGTVQSSSVFVVMSLSQLVTVLRFKQLQRAFDAMKQLEHDIRMRSLIHRSAAATKFERSYIQRQLMRKSGYLLLFTCFFHTYINYRTTSNMALWLHLVIACTTTLIQVKSVEYCLMVQQVHLLLQQLNEELQFVRRQLIATQRQAERRGLYAALQFNQQFLSRVWCLVNNLESYFGMPMIILFLYDISALTITVNWVYTLLKYNGEIGHDYFSWLFSVSPFINMLVPCWICQSCIQLYESFARLLHTLHSDGSDVKLSMCIREYSLQLMHQKLIFSCEGLLDVNLSSFGSRVITLTTYAVILIQFRLQFD